MKCAIINADFRAAAAAESLCCSDLQLYVHTVIFFFCYFLFVCSKSSLRVADDAVARLASWSVMGKGGRRVAEQGQ